MLKIDDLSVRYSRTSRPAVDRVSIEVADGEVVCVVGESGSGKSTLALACLRLLDSASMTTGRVDLEGRDLLNLSDSELRKVRGRDIGFVNQDALSSFSAYWSVGEQISETVRIHTKTSRKEAWARTLEQLDAVKVHDPERVARSYPHELSGGQRQRAALAMAMVLKPRFLIADEPTSALDVTTASHLLVLLKQLQREQGIGVLFITHDMRVVESIADRIAVMYAGVMGEVGPRADVMARPRYPYTKALIDALDLERPRGALSGVRGTPPGLNTPIEGCPFAARCDRAQDICSRMAPPTIAIGTSMTRCHFPLVQGEAGFVHSPH